MFLLFSKENSTRKQYRIYF